MSSLSLTRLPSKQFAAGLPPEQVAAPLFHHHYTDNHAHAIHSHSPSPNIYRRERENGYFVAVP